MKLCKLEKSGLVDISVDEFDILSLHLFSSDSKSQDRIGIEFDNPGIFTFLAFWFPLTRSVFQQQVLKLACDNVFPYPLRVLHS